MITNDVIEEVKNRLVEAYHPVEIYLFGSYAWGTPDEDSDLDILIVVEKTDEKRYKRSYRASDALKGLRISKDILVLTKNEFEKANKDVTTLSYKIKNKGKKIYAIA